MKLTSVFYFCLVLLLIVFSCVNNDLAPKKFDCTVSTLSIKLDSITKASSCSVADGAIYVTTEGGEQPYTYKINNKVLPVSDSIGGLLPGVYTITVTDKNGCEQSIDNAKVLADGFEFSATVKEDVQCINNHDGQVTVEVQGDNEPFQFKIGTGEFSDNNVFDNLSYGSYDITVRDALSCSIQLHVTVPKGFTGVSWNTDILPIIKVRCATSGCHNGTSRVDYRIYANAKKNAAKMKTLTLDGSMPFDGPKLTSDQIKLISCWVDDGALEN